MVTAFTTDHHVPLACLCTLRSERGKIYHNRGHSCVLLDTMGTLTTCMNLLSNGHSIICLYTQTSEVKHVHSGPSLHRQWKTPCSQSYEHDLNRKNKTTNKQTRNGLLIIYLKKKVIKKVLLRDIQKPSFQRGGAYVCLFHCFNFRKRVGTTWYE